MSNGTVTPTPPAAPNALTADANSPTEVQVRWTDNANNETGYVVQRSTAGGAFFTVAQLGANSTSYTNTGLTASTDILVSEYQGALYIPIAAVFLDELDETIAYVRRLGGVDAVPIVVADSSDRVAIVT